MKIHLHIDSLLVDGSLLEHRDTAALARAVQAQLLRGLAGDRVWRGGALPQRVGVVGGTDIELPGSFSTEVLGQRIADSLHGAIASR